MKKNLILNAIALILSIFFVACSKSNDPKPEAEILPDKIEITVYTGQMNIGDRIKLTHGLLPEGIKDPAKYKVEWTSENPKVAEIKNGELVALYPGNTIITAKIKGTDIESRQQMTVLAPQITGLTLKFEKDTILVGEQTKLTYEILPKGSNPEFYEIEWTNDAGIKLDRDGTVTGALGSYRFSPPRVSAKIKNSNITATATIFVDKKAIVAKQNQEILMPNGLLLKVSYSKVTQSKSNPNVQIYSVQYSVTNRTPDKTFYMTYIKLVPKTGHDITPGAYFNTPIYPGDTRTGYNTYEVLKTSEILYFEYPLNSNEEKVVIPFY